MDLKNAPNALNNSGGTQYEIVINIYYVASRYPFASRFNLDLNSPLQQTFFGVFVKTYSGSSYFFVIYNLK